MGHCIIVSCGYLHSSGARCSQCTLGVHHQKCPRSQIFAFARAWAHTAWAVADPEFPPAPGPCVMMSADEDGQITGGGSILTCGNMVTTFTTQPKSGLSTSTSTQGGNRHIWSWSLKTDRHLALWIVVISSKCDNTKRFNVTSLKASFDAGHAPGAW